MSHWVATAFGALDLHDHQLEEQGFDLLVVPTAPGAPVFLSGAGAQAWRQLVQRPILEGDLDGERLETVEALGRMGLASCSPHDWARVETVSEPWLKSPLHEVVYALIQKVAEQNRIEVIFIKGPTLFAQGLRTREHSGDVDCWVAPGDDVRLTAAMAEWGWEPLFLPFTGTGVTHSLTLRAGDWGCEIDVHTRFPGMSADPSRAFDLIRDVSEPRVFASIVCRTPARAPHAVVAALHELRPSLGSQPGSAARNAAAHALRHGGSEVIELTRQMRAGHALSESLREAFPDAPLNLGDVRPPRDWIWRGTRDVARRHMIGLALVPVKMMPRVLWRLLWPSRAVLLNGDAATTSTAGQLASRRVRRLWTALWMLSRIRR